MGSGGSSVCAFASAAGTAAPGTTCNVPYERAPTQATRIKRIMMPTTLATTSRNESKLKAISRTGRRRRIMMIHQEKRLSWFPLFLRFQVFPCHRNAQAFQRWVGRVVGAQPVGMNEEPNLRPIGQLAGAH